MKQDKQDLLLCNVWDIVLKLHTKNMLERIQVEDQSSQACCWQTSHVGTNLAGDWIDVFKYV